MATDESVPEPPAPDGVKRGARPPRTLQPLTLLVVFTGYIGAVAVATAVTVFLMLLPGALPDGGAPGRFVRSLVEVGPPAMVIGYFYTFLCALPGFIVAVWIGERERWTGWRRYGVAGFLNVIPAMVLFNLFSGSPFAMPIMVAASFPGGYSGGVAYWFGAGSFVARRRLGA